MTTYTIDATTTLVTHECYRCHVMFAMPQELNERALADHSIAFYCPNGHGAAYTGKTTAEKAAERATWYAQQLASRDEDLRSARAAHSVTKGKLTKARNRADKGVCQHCNRHFVNVARHVASQHAASGAES